MQKAILKTNNRREFYIVREKKYSNTQDGDKTQSILIIQRFVLSSSLYPQVPGRKTELRQDKNRRISRTLQRHQRDEEAEGTAKEEEIREEHPGGRIPLCHPR